MWVVYILFHYYSTIIRIIFLIIFPITSQRTIISLYYFTITSLFYLFFLQLFLIISGFWIPIFTSWRTPICVLCSKQWLISVQECQQGFGMTRQARFMKRSLHIQLREDYYTHYFLYYFYYFHCLSRACNIDLRTAGRHTTILWDVSCHRIKKKALLPVTWAQFMAFPFLLYELYHYYFLLYVWFHKSESAFGGVFNAENLPMVHPPRGIREHTIQEH